MQIFAHSESSDIHDPNFNWNLLGQILFGLAIAMLCAWLLNKVLSKFIPKLNWPVRYAVVLITIFVLISAMGLLTEYLD